MAVSKLLWPTRKNQIGLILSENITPCCASIVSDADILDISVSLTTEILSTVFKYLGGIKGFYFLALENQEIHKSRWLCKIAKGDRPWDHSYKGKLPIKP